MNADFHYYATYCAALIAGFNTDEAFQIAYSANFVDCCTRTILSKCGGPLLAATTQSQLELADFNTDPISLQEITRIWSSFHFLPGDLYFPINYGSKNYKNKYRLICKPNGLLLKDTIELARGKSLESIGIAMHILADTWAHQHFAGTPSLVINNTNKYFYEIIGEEKYPISFSHNPTKGDSIDDRRYINSLYQQEEKSIMNLGHGRAGHLPDLSFIKYEYMPAYGKWKVFIKDNPSDYLKAFSQMVYSLKYLKGEKDNFELNEYDDISKYKATVIKIINTRKLNLSNEWKNLAEEISGCTIKDFDVNEYINEYKNSNDKDNCHFGLFINHALRQKSMVVNRIYKSKNKLAGFSIDYNGGSLKGIKDYWKLIQHEIKEKVND